MKQRNFKLSMLILSILPAQTSFSDDFKAQVDGLKKNQAALDQMIGPYRALGGFKESKNPFLAKDEEQKPSLLHFHNSPSKLQAPIGKFLFGRTLNRLVVGTEKNPAIIQIKPDQGSFSDLRFMGTATQASTPGRVAIEIQRVVFKGGSSKALAALALDRNGALGVEAHVLSQKALTVAGALASSFISGIAASEQTVSSNSFGFEMTQRSPHNALLGGLAQTAADQSKRLVEEATAEKPILILEADTEVTLLLQEEVRF